MYPLFLSLPLETEWSPTFPDLALTFTVATPAGAHLNLSMFHYPQLDPNFFHPTFPHNLAPKTKRPTISFCPAFSKGHCQFGDFCRLNHIDVSDIRCKYDLKGICKHGSRCIFKHEVTPQNETSTLSPLIQHIVQENSLFSQRLSQAEEKIFALEQELTALRNLVRAPHSPESKSQPMIQPRQNPKHAASKTEVPKIPPRPTNKTIPNLPRKNPLERPAEQKSKLPWIKSAVRISQKRPKLRKPLHFTYQQHTIDFSLISETEKVVKTRPPTKTEVNPCFHSTNSWKVLEEDQEDLEQPALTIPICPPSRYLKEPDADREEKLIKLEQLFIESWKELLASFNELAPSPELKLLT